MEELGNSTKGLDMGLFCLGIFRCCAKVHKKDREYALVKNAINQFPASRVFDKKLTLGQTGPTQTSMLHL